MLLMIEKWLWAFIPHSEAGRESEVRKLTKHTELCTPADQTVLTGNARAR